MRDHAYTLAGEGCGDTTIFAAVADSVVRMNGGRVEHLTLSGGGAPRGGGLKLDGGEGVLDNVCVSENYAFLRGGGISVNEGTLTVYDSLIYDNEAFNIGGGVYVDTGGVLSDWAFPTEYSAVLANQSSDELSRDGRWLAGMGLVDGNDARIFTFDLDAGQLGTELSIAELYDGPCSAGEGYDPDWVGVSPLGNWLVVQWVTGDPGRCNGLETFDIATGEFVGRVTLESPHADLTVLDDGETEVFVTAELLAPGAGEGYVDGTAGGTALEDSYPSFAYRVLPGDPVGTAEPNHLVLTDWIFEHISCRGPYGWCLVTAANSPGNGVWDPLEEELFLLKLDGSGVVRLGHPRPDPTIQPTDDDYYWAQPRASFSASGRYVIFDTNWGVAPDTHAYVIDLGE